MKKLTLSVILLLSVLMVSGFVSASDFSWAINTEASWPEHSSAVQENFPDDWTRWTSINSYADSFENPSASWNEDDFSNDEFGVNLTRSFTSEEVIWVVNLSKIVGHWHTGVQLVIANDSELLFQVGWNSQDTSSPFYQEYNGGWNSREPLPEGISVSGEYNEEIYTITIDKSFLDNDAPEITEIENIPEYPTCEDEVKICAMITDASEIDEVKLHWNNGVDSGTFTMDPEDSMYCKILSGTTLSASDGMEVSYSIYAEDVFGNNDTQPSEDITFTFDCEDPNVDFTCTPTEGDEDLSVSCTADASDSVTPKDELQYSWDFGNGVISDEENPSVTYIEDGSYDVSLSVTDNAGHVSTETKENYVVVGDTIPIASFDVSPVPVEEGVELTFTDMSTAHDPLGSWLWDFGDGETSSEENPTHTYADNDTYTVMLTVCEETESDDCDSVSKDVVVTNVVPDVDAGQYKCNENETITLTASASDVSADEPFEFFWDLNGDHNFNVEGKSVDYTCGNGDDNLVGIVAVRVFDKDGQFGEDAANITIKNVAPTANAGGDYQGVVGENIEVSASASDPIETDFTYKWDCDYDGENFTDTPLSGQAVSCSYSSKGTYTVAVIANDGEDDSEISTALVEVYDYKIGLMKGWNLVSFPLVPENDDTAYSSVLSDVKCEIERVWAYQYNPESGDNEWVYKTVSDECAWSGSHDFDNIIPGYGYYIKMRDNSTLYQNGEKMYGNSDDVDAWDVPKPPVVTLAPSWNLIGHYGMRTGINKTDALTTLNGNYATILGENGQIISEFNPTEGYWLFLTGTNSLDYAPSEADYQ